MASNSNNSSSSSSSSSSSDQQATSRRYLERQRQRQIQIQSQRQYQPKPKPKQKPKPRLDPKQIPSSASKASSARSHRHRSGDWYHVTRRPTAMASDNSDLDPLWNNLDWYVLPRFPPACPGRRIGLRSALRRHFRPAAPGCFCTSPAD